MKLAYVSNQRLPTEKAYGIQITQMCRAFSSLGVDVELVLPSRQGAQGDNVSEYYGVSGFSVRRIRTWDPQWGGRMQRVSFWLKQIFSAVAMTWYVRAGKSDIVYTRDESVAVLARMAGKRVVLELHSFSGARRALYRLLGLMGVPLVCISVALKRDLVAIGCDGRRILVAPDGVDLSAFENLPDRAEARKRVHLPADMPIVLYAGHLYEWKGVDVLAEAARKIDGLVVFVGGTEADVARMKSKYGTTPNIMFVGHRPHSEIPLWLRAADVLVLPNTADTAISRLYTSPLKMFEYMASGTPIIASDIPSIREVLNTMNSVLVPQGNSVHLAEALNLMIRGRSTNRAQKAASDVSQYSWPSRTEEILNFTGV